MQPAKPVTDKVELPTGKTETFLATVAEKLGGAARASAIFAEPVERNGVTVIPVAKARWAFGGGVGQTRNEEGGGGGGAAQVNPIGFIEVRDGEAVFKPIYTVSRPLVVAASIASIFLLRSLFRPKR